MEQYIERIKQLEQENSLLKEKLKLILLLKEVKHIMKIIKKILYKKQKNIKNAPAIIQKFQKKKNKNMQDSCEFLQYSVFSSILIILSITKCCGFCSSSSSSSNPKKILFLI